MTKKNEMHHTVTFNKKRLSSLVSATIIAQFLIFVGGYLLGKKNAYDETTHLIRHATFIEHHIEQINALGKDEFTQEVTNNTDVVQARIKNCATYAQAVDVVEKLKKMGIASTIVKHIGFDTDKNQKAWYQVITTCYKDIADLKQHINKLPHQDCIDVQII